MAKHYPGGLEGETRSSARRLAEDEGFRTALLLTPDPNYADVSLDLALMGKAMSDARRVMTLPVRIVAKGALRGGMEYRNSRYIKKLP